MEYDVWDGLTNSSCAHGVLFVKYVSSRNDFYILVQFHRDCHPGGPIDNRAALVHVMTWCHTREKPLPEPITTQFTGANMHPRPVCRDHFVYASSQRTAALPVYCRLSLDGRIHKMTPVFVLTLLPNNAVNLLINRI